MDIKIENMKPIRRRGGLVKYPFEDLEVGQGFRVPRTAKNSVMAIASRLKRDTVKRFVCNVDGDEVRVCRVEDGAK